MEYSDNLLYKLWLSIVLGHNPTPINKAIKRFGSAEDIFNSDETYYKFLKSLKLTSRLTIKRKLDDAKALLEYCNENGISVITIDDSRYPKRLKEIYSPPQILYVKGELPDFDNLITILIVGSRKCTEYSKEFTYNLAYNLASSGFLVISGMANGIDSSAHRGALSAGNITVAALAGGVDVIYPKENKTLYGEIISSGAVISERPPQTIGRGSFYRERNRILVGLSNGVIITEGEFKSGSSLTANWAITSNRDLFAVPGKPDDTSSQLPNSLIKDCAKLITSSEDVLEEYLPVYPKEIENGLNLINAEKANNIKPKNANNKLDSLIPIKPDFNKFDEKQRIILEYLYKNKDKIHIDQISRDCDIEITELSFLIIQLLMAKAILEFPGEYYQIA